MILSYGGYWNSYGEAFRLGLNLFGGVEGVSADISIGDATYCATVADGEWHHYAAVVPSVGLGPPLISDVKVYQDGELLSTICASNGLWVPVNTKVDNPIDIGQSYAPLFGQYWQTFNGIIDEVALYDRALTDEEILELYKHGLGPKIVAIENIEGAISEKVEALERIDVALGREWLAYAALEELLVSGDYGDLNKADILRAKQDIFAAIQQQEQSKNALEQSLQKLEDSLRLLDAEVQP